MLPEAFLQFHFLRPEWLIGLIILPIMWLVLNTRSKQTNDWGKSIDPTLLAHLTPSSASKHKRVRHNSLLIALGFSVLAMAGPTWQEKPQPVIEVNDNMVVILDLSISMLATDTAPNRLVRTKQKLQDLLNQRKEGNTALIAFSGDSHVVTPLTDDTKTIIANLPALDPFVMPVIGSRPDLAITQAIALLEQGGATRGRIILMTDGVEPHQAERINDALDKKNISLSILAAGSKNGAPINLPDNRGYLKDGDQVVIPKTDFSKLASLASKNNGDMLAIALDDSDLERLDISGDRLVQQKLEESEQGLDKRFDAWEDMGYVFVLVILPFALLAYRQGALLLLLVIIYPHEKSYAFEWEDLWQTADQQAQRLLEQGKVNQAAEKFKDPNHKAYAQYQAGQYEQSAESYSLRSLSSQSQPQETNNSDLNLTNQYNLGNALAKQQKFEEAIAAYDSVLEQNPDHEDAKFNKQLVEQILEQAQDSESQSDQNQQNQDSSQEQQDNQSSDQQNSDDQNQSEQDQNNADQSDSNQDSSKDQSNQQSKQQESDDSQDNEQSQAEQTQNESEDAQDEQVQEQPQAQPSEEDSSEQQPAMAEAMPQEELSDEEKQSFEQWMRRVPDDPGGLLRRKFEQQARERNRTEREQGEPLW